MDSKYKDHLLQKLCERHKEKSKEEIELESTHDINKELTRKERIARDALNKLYFKIQDMYEHFQIKGKLGHSMVVEKHLLKNTVEYNNFEELCKLSNKVKKTIDAVRSERNGAKDDVMSNTNVIVDAE